MKKFYLIIFVFIIGCGSFRLYNYNYSVRFHNIGNNEIRLFPFKIAHNKKYGDVWIGNLISGGSADNRPFYWEPVESTEIEWQDLLTNKKYHKKVKITLPKQLAKYRNHLITIIFVLSKDESIKVLFGIWNDKIKDYTIVDSEGIETDYRTMRCTGAQKPAPP